MRAAIIKLKSVDCRLYTGLRLKVWPSRGQARVYACIARNKNTSTKPLLNQHPKFADAQAAKAAHA